MRTLHNRARRIIAEDHRGPQFPLTFVVGRLDVAARQEHEQLVACVDKHGVAQVPALGIGRLEVEQAVEFARQAAAVAGDRRVGEVRPAATDRAGILQECLELRSEDRVAMVDGELGISDQMREAELMRLSVGALRGEPVGQPHLRFRAVEKRSRHALSACRCDQMIHGGGAAERPLPPRLAFDARARFVRRDDRAGAHGRGDRPGVDGERFADAGEHIGDGALRDGQAEQAVERFGQALETHQLATVQIRDVGCDGRAERRAFGHVGGRRGGDALLAARACAAEQIDARRDRLDDGKVDMVVGAGDLLVARFERRAAGAAFGEQIARDIGARSQCATDTGAAFARPLLRRRCDIGLLPA